MSGQEDRDPPFKQTIYSGTGEPQERMTTWGNRFGFVDRHNPTIGLVIYHFGSQEQAPAAPEPAKNDPKKPVQKIGESKKQTRGDKRRQKKSKH